MTFDRITVEPGKMNGQPCIRGLRIPVATVVAMVADGMTTADDQSIVTTAAQQDRVIVSADTDVGTLLAQSGARSPSVLLLRLRSPRRARQLADLLVGEPRRRRRGPGELRRPRAQR